MTGPRISLQRDALRANVARVRQLVGPECQVMFAVKSNAYGHGMDLIVPELVAQGVSEFAVLDVHTGREARALAPNAALFAWLFGPHDDYQLGVDNDLEWGVSTTWQLDALAASKRHKPVTVHLKIDTGLHRNGATPQQWPGLLARALELEADRIITVRAIWSHLADTSTEASRQALSRLHDATAAARKAGLRPEILHLAASHGAVELPETRLDMVRLGILAYGVSPFDKVSAKQLGFRPLLSLHAPIISTTPPTVTLGVGYAHGLLPPQSSDAFIRVGQRKAQVISVGATTTTVYLDQADEDIAQGDVVIFGASEGAPSVEQWATWCNTIGDEVLARLRSDIPRLFSD